MKLSDGVSRWAIFDLRRPGLNVSGADDLAQIIDLAIRMMPIHAPAPKAGEDMRAILLAAKARADAEFDRVIANWCDEKPETPGDLDQEDSEE